MVKLQLTADATDGIDITHHLVFGITEREVDRVFSLYGKNRAFGKPYFLSVPLFDKAGYFILRGILQEDKAMIVKMINKGCFIPSIYLM